MTDPTIGYRIAQRRKLSQLSRKAISKWEFDTEG